MHTWPIGDPNLTDVRPCREDQVLNEDPVLNMDKGRCEDRALRVDWTYRHRHRPKRTITSSSTGNSE